MEQPTSKTPDRKSALKTVTKKGITVNPKKEDLMKETMKAKLGASMDACLLYTSPSPRDRG